MDMKEMLKQFREDFLLFLKGAFDLNDKATRFLRKEAYDAQDNFMLLCFGDLLGLPVPTSYYEIELLPYLLDDIQGWERRMIRRSEIWEQKWADYDVFG
ncbi:MAG TPA: hypothetical protein VEG39_17670 [Clostridia bacterium]|nr:hypothetical protein [Clostridia bacterium]